MRKTGANKSLHNLSARQLAALAVINAGGTHEQAATAAEVHRVTVTRWVNHHPAFVAELNRLRHEAFSACYLEILGTTRAAIGVANRALETDNGDFALRWLRLALPGIDRNASLAQTAPRDSIAVVETHRRSMRSTLEEGLALGPERSTHDAEAELLRLIDDS